MFFKRLLSILILTTFSFLLFGCVNDTDQTQTTEDTEATASTEEEEEILDSFKVLAIGNSFSMDAVEYLYSIASYKGIPDVVIGNLYIAGCDLETHWRNASNNNSHYTYYKNSHNQWRSSSRTSILTALEEEDWDYIIVQQVSSKSGLIETHDPYLENLVEYINTHKTNPEAKVAWHFTWAYQSDSNHGEFHRYDHDQMTMYNAIVETVKTRIVPDESIDIIIPAGTAIQNARTSYLGDTLTRDGYHLDLTIGRMIAGMSWFKALSGLSIDDIYYYPSGMNFEILDVIKESVNNAVAKPFEVTTSEFQPEEINLDDYTELTLEYKMGYWNSIDSGYPNVIIDFNAIAQQFVTHTVRLTKEDLPNGTILVIDEGYRYRINYWKDEDSSPSENHRSQLVSIQTTIDDNWWLGNEYVAFNITTTTGDNVADQVEEVASHFKIYIPKDK